MNSLLRPVRLLVAALALPGTAPVVHAQAPLIARFSTVAGDFDVLLDAQAAPVTVSNFVRYAGAGLYDGTFIHRSTTYNPDDIQIIQGGSFSYDGVDPQQVPLFDPIPLEASLSNTRGTIAMARTTDEDSATSGWFFNLEDNPGLDPSPVNAGYAVFGRVLGDGVDDVVDLLGTATVYNFSGTFGAAFGELPLIESAGQFYLLTIYEITVVPFRITSARREPGGFRVEWPALSTNTPVNVERRTSLSSGGWMLVSSNNTNATFLDTNAPSSGAFYRVVLP